MTHSDDTKHTAAHTPEPWGDNENGVILGNLDHYAGEAPVVAVVEGYDANGKAHAEARANTRRIVACVNACKNLSTEALEAGILAQLRYLLGEMLTAAGDLDVAIDSATDEFDIERARLNAAVRAAQTVLGGTVITLGEVLAERGQITLGWSINDVQQVRPDLTEEEAWWVLQQVERKHDATIGVTWDRLESTAEQLFGPRTQTDAEEEQP